MRALLSLRRVPEPDAADALAIAICHARHRTMAVVERAAAEAAAEQETRPRRPRVR